MSKVKQNKDGSYDSSIRDVAPHPDAVRLTGKTHNGLASGVHTGGAWLLEGEVWKPQDGRVHAGEDSLHVPTSEHAMLVAMGGKPMYPHDWRFETREGRNWIVREKGILIPEDMNGVEVSDEDVYQVETGVIEANRMGWSVGDWLSVARDPNTYELYFYDLSACMFDKSDHSYHESFRVSDWIKDVRPDLHALRKSAEKIMCERVIEDFFAIYGDDASEHQLSELLSFTHVYASFYRKVDPTWATSLPEGSKLVHEVLPSIPNSVPHTWVLTNGPIPVHTAETYQLKLAYENWHRILSADEETGKVTARKAKAAKRRRIKRS